MEAQIAMEARAHAVGSAPERGSVPALSMRGIRKSFNGVPVLKGVDFEVQQGEIHALVGSNGAGKSTLLKILDGAYTADAGTVEIDGRPVHAETTTDARGAGVAMIFQEFSLVPTLSVAENIFLGREPRGWLGFIDDGEANRRARDLFSALNLEVDPSRSVDRLPTAAWQLTEIAKAMSQNARVVVMDEPTSSLARSETVVLFALMRRLKAQGTSIVFVSHRLEEIFEVCDRITVLRDGRRIRTEELSNLTMGDVIDDILGRKVEQTLGWKPRPARAGARTLLEVRGLTSGPKLRGIDLQVREGEIVGLAGLMGCGRSELARAIFGIDPIESGEVVVDGQPLGRLTPQRAIAAGIALVPEDRRTEGLVLDHPVRENFLLPIVGRISRAGFIDDAAGQHQAESYVKQLNIVTRSIDQPIGLLSGGNQQKVVIAKWLATKPRILIMDEATAGVDVGTKAEIVEMIRTFADAGNCVIFISSELPELLAVSDRVLILHDGRVKRELDRSEIRHEDDLHHIVQGTR